MPKEFWPATIPVYINENSTLPKLKEKELKTQINGQSFIELVAIVDYFNKSGRITKYILCRQEIEGLYDFFTEEYIGSGRLVENIVNETYFKNINLDPGEDVTFLDVIFYSDESSYGCFDPNLGIKFKNIRTVEDVIEFYQFLPKDLQVDYSYFDFSKSPRVDPAWLANRPTPAPTPIPTPTPTPTPAPYAELRVGNRGQEVLDMKLRFFELGYFRTDKYNDSFSDSTEDTVRLFEKNNGLKADGIADAEMLGLLFSDRAVGK